MIICLLTLNEEINSAYETLATDKTCVTKLIICENSVLIPRMNIPLTLHGYSESLKSSISSLALIFELFVIQYHPFTDSRSVQRLPR